MELVGQSMLLRKLLEHGDDHGMILRTQGRSIRWFDRLVSGIARSRLFDVLPNVTPANRVDKTMPQFALEGLFEPGTVRGTEIENAIDHIVDDVSHRVIAVVPLAKPEHRMQDPISAFGEMHEQDTAQMGITTQRELAARGHDLPRVLAWQAILSSEGLPLFTQSLLRGTDIGVHTRPRPARA
ncbi:hypothetical protein EBB05_01405 [Methylobacterium brachiatum]|nr:hypothetical protein EBB05_01405 [Methylobacterium brachiatum]